MRESLSDVCTGQVRCEVCEKSVAQCVSAGQGWLGAGEW